MESEMNRPAEPESQAGRDGMNQASAAFDHTKRTMSQAYDRSARAIGDTYNHAVAFGRQNPGKTTLIAFGVGVGVGMFLFGSRRRSRVRRYGEPVVNALSNMAMEFIRSL
jgi:ElaB/YqjD/DUF883 family membrane-anchored ribosome-binding protein